MMAVMVRSYQTKSVQGLEFRTSMLHMVSVMASEATRDNNDRDLQQQKEE